MIKELKQLNDTFYKIFDDLKEAGKSLAGNDEAIKCIREKILAQYKLEYKLLDLKYRVETEREIAKLEARYDRLVPQRWRQRFLLFFKRRKQNYAATLIDIEANQKAKEFFAECEKEIAEWEARQLAEVQVQVEIDEEFEIIDDASEGATEFTLDESQGESESAPAEEPTDTLQEQAQPPTIGEESSHAGDESSPPCGEISSNVLDTKSPQTEKKKGKKEKKGGKKNVREGDQVG